VWLPSPLGEMEGYNRVLFLMIRGEGNQNSLSGRSPAVGST